MVKIKKDSFRPAKREFRMAWDEYFENNKEAETPVEIEKQIEDFMNWYNNVRKQSDTGKTPAEMHKEIYGKELYGEENFNPNYEEELFSMAGEIFDKEIWHKVKEEVNGLSKKETADYLFGLGFIAHFNMIAESVQEIADELKYSEFSKKVKKQNKNGK